ncbi:Uncharacterised protein [Mycobacterium tuberculosis]|nr:Uncharacterised protein [Mycobacterium tuberculosis]
MSKWSSGRRLLSMRTTKPIRTGSQITESAKTSTVDHMVSNRTPPLTIVVCGASSEEITPAGLSVTPSGRSLLACPGGARSECRRNECLALQRSATGRRTQVRLSVGTHHRRRRRKPGKRR